MAWEHSKQALPPHFIRSKEFLDDQLSLKTDVVCLTMLSLSPACLSGDSPVTATQ